MREGGVRGVGAAETTAQRGHLTPCNRLSRTDLVVFILAELWGLRSALC
jgi:hypothetical protein